MRHLIHVRVACGNSCVLGGPRNSCVLGGPRNSCVLGGPRHVSCVDIIFVGPLVTVYLSLIHI